MNKPAFRVKQISGRRHNEHKIRADGKLTVWVVQTVAGILVRSGANMGAIMSGVSVSWSAEFYKFTVSRVTPERKKNLYGVAKELIDRVRRQAKIVKP